MKTSAHSILVVFLVLNLGCSKDETPNTNPSAFELTSVRNNANGVALTPMLTWSKATDAEQTNITYDVFLDETENPSEQIASGLATENYEIQDRLRLKRTYYWKVVAKDGKGGISESSTFTFTTRDLKETNDVIEDAGYTKSRKVYVTIFKNDFWMISGNEVWYSSNGATWQQRATLPLNGFRDYTVVVYDQKLWVIGGYFNDSFTNHVWNSTDGVTWRQVVPLNVFSPRALHSSVVFDNKMWVLGGSTMSGPVKDTWYSTDGIHWTLATDTAEFGRLSSHESVVFDEKMWVVGGYHTPEQFSGFPTNTVYYSTDGISWEQSSETFPTDNTHGHALAVYDDKLWILGGKGQEGNYLEQIWHSEDGAQWERALNEYGRIFPPREGHAVVPFKQALWIIGGYNNENGYLGDVRVAN